MADLSISLPEPLSGWARERVDAGLYPNASAYVGDLIRRDREHREKLARLQAAIDEGMASPICEEDAFEALNGLRARLRNLDRGEDAA